MSSLSATYSSPTNEPFSSSATIAPLASDSPADKETYFNALGKAVSTLQDTINKELTARMEQDNAALAQAGKAVDDSKEEENYGEEVVSDDE